MKSINLLLSMVFAVRADAAMSAEQKPTLEQESTIAVLTFAIVAARDCGDGSRFMVDHTVVRRTMVDERLDPSDLEPSGRFDSAVERWTAYAARLYKKDGEEFCTGAWEALGSRGTLIRGMLRRR